MIPITVLYRYCGVWKLTKSFQWFELNIKKLLCSPTYRIHATVLCLDIKRHCSIFSWTDICGGCAIFNVFIRDGMGLVFYDPVARIIPFTAEVRSHCRVYDSMAIMVFGLTVRNYNIRTYCMIYGSSAKKYYFLDI